MRPVVTLRPGQHSLVRLPYRKGGANYQLLKDIRGPGTREPKWNAVEQAFEVPRANGDRLIVGLVEEFGRILVVVHGHRQVSCVSDCWNASPATAWDCVCGCAGSNHGTGHPLGREVASGLSIEHQYSIGNYDVDEDGWTLLDA
ncbi:hypothetical protein [Agrococcus sp. Ld7]|uniref:hypothetical protein n=1 Tax=Agrococcus sp. Ld7 TaxID=649148 RepID=UPI003870102C